MRQSNKNYRMAVALLVLVTTAVLIFLPTGFDSNDKGIRCKAKIVSTDNADISRFGVVLTGDQEVVLEMLDGPFDGQEFHATNKLLGRMDLDKVFAVNDTIMAVITPDHNGNPIYINAQDHYRLDTEIFLLVLFAALLLLYGGWTGLNALLSFVFSAMMIWKVLIPSLLQGYPPIWIALGVVTLLCAVIIFLVAGINRMGMSAFSGAFLGVITSALLALFFTAKLKLHGAVLPFAETLLYSGYAHLDIAQMYVAAVFIAASGAVMDIAMDISASMQEVVANTPEISRLELFLSGLRVGRAVVGTMTTTLLFAYSGGYITLLMAFMAQGIPPESIFNLIYVAAEVLKTLVGSFGLVMVAPFTALTGAFLLNPAVRKAKRD
ncbi:MAG: YibE/F family protein [Desulfovibrio sp.]